MGEVNWALSLLIGLVFSIPVGIFANLLTPRVQEWLERRAITTHGKTLARLKSDYERIKNLHSNGVLLQLVMTRYVVRSVAFLVFFVPGLFAIQFLENPTTKFLLYALIFFAAYITGFTSDNIVSDITRLIRFEEYESQVLAQISQLESRLGKTSSSRGV
jgi:ABC-type multidrug transport system fused ATPase/permease subunit